MVVSFDSGEGRVIAIVEVPKSLVLSFFGEDTDHGGTKTFLLGDG